MVAGYLKQQAMTAKNKTKNNKHKNHHRKPNYWYVTTIRACVLCGRENTSKYRVYEKPKTSIIWQDDACSTHFI